MSQHRKKILGLKRKDRRQRRAANLPQAQGASEGAAVNLPNINRADQDTDALIADLALEYWRLRRRVDRIAPDLGDDRIRLLRDSLQRVEDVMAAHRLEVLVHEKERYTEGSSLVVIHERSRGETMVVAETILPTIRFPDRIIRNGQVIIEAAPGAEESEA